MNLIDIIVRFLYLVASIIQASLTLGGAMSLKVKSLVFLVFGLVTIFLSTAQLSSQGFLAKLEGDEIEISKDPGDQQNPHVIYLPDKNLWFVAYEDWSDPAKGSEIKGVFIRPDGSKCGTDFYISSNTQGNGNQTMPRAAYRDGAGKPDPTDRIMVVWQDTRSSSVDGYIYYASLDVSSYTATEALCTTPTISTETPIDFEDDDLSTPGTQPATVARSMPKVAYDLPKDRFLVAWVSSKSPRKTVSYVPFTTQGGVITWVYGDVLFPGYCAIKGDMSGYDKSPTIIVQRDEGGNNYTRARGLSSSESNYEETRTYEIFDEVANVDVACDTTTQECLIVWEGKKGIVSIENTCTDDAGESTSNGICDANDIVTSDSSISYPNSQKLIYGLFEKNFDLAVNSIQVSDSTSDCYYPSIGFDPVSHKFLAVWEDLRDGPNTKIYGQLILSGGGLYNKNFIVSFQDTDGDNNQDSNVANSRQTRPYVSFDSVNQRYFVAWQDGRNGSVSIENLDIYGQYIDSEGTLRGTNYAISTAPSNQQSPAIAYNSKENQFLAAWKDGRNTTETGSDIYGQRFSLGQPQITLLKIDDTPLAPALIDFGSTTVNKFSTYSFKVKNTGDTYVNIDCIDPQPSSPFGFENLPSQLLLCSEGGAEPTVSLVPNAELTFTVKFNPTEKGTFTDSFTIISDAGDRTINLQGIAVSAELTVEEGDGTNDSTLDFGNVKLGQSKDVTFTLINNGNIGYNITSIAGLQEPFSYVGTVNFPINLNPGSQYTIIVRYSPSEKGISLSQLTINTDQTGLSATLKLQGKCTAPVLQVLTTNYDFGVVTVGEAKYFTLTLNNIGDDDLSISSCGSLPAGFSFDGACPTTVSAGGSASVSIKFMPQDIASYGGSFQITSNGGSQTISVSGQGAGPKIEVSPAQVDFGTIMKGSSKGQGVVITNIGNATLEISNISSPSAPFAVKYEQPLDLIKLQPGTSFNLLVEFSPTTKGFYSSSFTISSNAVNLTKTVYVQGTAIEPEITINPNPAIFEDTGVGSTKSVNILVKNDSTKAITILKVNEPSSPFKLETPDITNSQVGPGEQVNLVVSFSPTVEGVFNSSLELLFDFQPSPVSISLTGIGKSQAAIVEADLKFIHNGAVITSLSFGNVLYGDVITKQVVVSNSGTSPIEITKISTNTNAFMVNVSTPFTLAANNQGAYTKAVDIKFLPKEKQTYSDILMLTDKSGLVYQLELDGTGAAQSATPTDPGVSLITDGYDTSILPSIPSSFTPTDAIVIYMTNVNQSAEISVKFLSIPSSPVFYKINKYNSWCKIYPTNSCSGVSNVSLVGATLKLTLHDNSDADKDPDSGVIYDPIVVGAEGAAGTTTTTTIPTGTGTGAGGGGGGSCFIATAAYGSGLHPYVIELKRFRDEILMKSQFGRSFVDLYYHISPPVAEFIQRHAMARAAVRAGLYPVVFAVMYPKAALGIFIFILLSLCAVNIRLRIDSTR